MKAIIIETSSECALIACVENFCILYEKPLSGGSEISKSLGTEIKKLIDACPPPYDRIIVGIGPGSYIGTRVGASMANALAFGWKIPLYTVSSLTAFGPGTVMIDAKSKGFFVQKEGAPFNLFSLSEATAFVSDHSPISSPHPEKILTQIPDITIEKKGPNPLRMFEKAAASGENFQILYAV